MCSWNLYSQIYACPTFLRTKWTRVEWFLINLLQISGYFPAHEYAPKFDFNPMDCTDIVIGTAKGNYHRVLDYYTRDR